MPLAFQVVLASLGFACLAPPIALYLATLGPLRALGRLQKQGDVHWTELARVRWGFLSAVRRCALFLYGGSVYLAWVLSHPHTGHARLLALCALILTLVVYVAVTGRLGRGVPGPRAKDNSFGDKLRSTAALLFILRGHAMASVVAFAVIPLDARSPWVAVTILVLVLFILWMLKRGSIWLPMKLGVVAPAPPRLAEHVNAAAQRFGLGSVSGYIVETPIANAFALLFAPGIGVTRGLLEALTDEQLDSILDHEAAHLAEGPARRWTYGAATFLLVPFVAALPVTATFGAAYGGLMASLSILILIASRKIAESLETRADAAAHGAEVHGGEYARALEALHIANLLPAVMRPGSDPHGSLYDRMVNAGVQPDYPRPHTPDPQRGLTMFLLLAYIAIVGASPLLQDMLQDPFQPTSADAALLVDE